MPQMTPERFQQIASHFSNLRIVVLGDFCLDRYLEIDPALSETSLETGLPVHNVTHVRSQAGGAGTVLNNLAALGVGTIFPIGISGSDGEGHELSQALRQPGVQLDYFLTTPLRQTFTYTKPLLMHRTGPPEELSRLDIKNWTKTHPEVSSRIIENLLLATRNCDALIVMEQADREDTGVITADLLHALEQLSRSHPGLLILADSRRGLKHFPPATFKMNLAELKMLSGSPVSTDEEIKRAVAGLASRNNRPAFVTLSENGIAGAMPGQDAQHLPAFPVRGPVDVVGAGDAVMASLGASLAAGASLFEAMEIAMAAASIVVHQFGTTGTASPGEITKLLSLRDNQ